MPALTLPVMGTASIPTHTGQKGQNAASPDKLTSDFAALLLSWQLGQAAGEKSGTPEAPGGSSGTVQVMGGNPGTPQASATAPNGSSGKKPIDIKDFLAAYLAQLGLSSGSDGGVKDSLPSAHGSKKAEGSGPVLSGEAELAALAQALLEGLRQGRLSDPAGNAQEILAKLAAANALPGGNTSGILNIPGGSNAGWTSNLWGETSASGAGSNGAWSSGAGSSGVWSKPENYLNFLKVLQGISLQELQGNPHSQARATLTETVRFLLQELSGTVQYAQKPPSQIFASKGAPLQVQLDGADLHTAKAGISATTVGTGRPAVGEGSNVPGPASSGLSKGTGNPMTQDGYSGGQQDTSHQAFTSTPVPIATGSSIQTAPAASLVDLAPNAPGGLVEVWQQISNGLLPNLRKGSLQIKELTLQLQPEKLGKIQIALRWDDKQVNLQIVAAEDGTAKILQGHLNDLRNSLENAGVSCGRLDLGFSGGFGRPWRQNLPQPFNPGFGGGQEQVTNSPSPPLLYEARGDEHYRVNVTA